MTYEEFKQYMNHELGEISDLELKELWIVYEQMQGAVGKVTVSILDLLVFIKQNIEVIYAEKVNKILYAFIYMVSEIFLNVLDKIDIEQIVEDNPYYNLFDQKTKNLCKKFVQKLLNEKITLEEKKEYILNYYSDLINIELTEKQLQNIILLHFNLSFLADELNIKKYIIRQVIIECFNNNNFNYKQSYDWCFGVISVMAIPAQDFNQLCIYIDEILKNNWDDVFNKYYILGCLNSLNDIFDNNFENEEVEKGKEYLMGESVNMLDIAELIVDYYHDPTYPNKSSYFVYGIIKEGLHYIEENNKNRKIFYNIVKNKTQLEDNDIDFLWGIYKVYSQKDEIDYDIIDILIFLHKNIKNSDKYIYYLLKEYMVKVNEFFKNYLLVNFSDSLIDDLKDNLYNKIKIFTLEDNLKEYCYKYADEKFEIMNENYYDESNIEDFFYNELFRLFEKNLTNEEIESYFNECCYLYNELIKIPRFEYRPKYIIKNIIIESFINCPPNITSVERLSYCLGRLDITKDLSLISINENIYNYYNKDNIDNKYKNVYYCYGNIYNILIDSIYINNLTNDVIKGINYYTENLLENDLFEIASNLNNYWYDEMIVQHNKDFQLGILYQGLEKYLDKNDETKKLINKNKIS